MAALEEALEHGEALVGKGQFVVAVGAVEQEVEMGVLDQDGFGRRAPIFGVEVEAEDEVWFD